jgi:alpha-1,2-mannosyltransferase
LRRPRRILVWSAVLLALQLVAFASVLQASARRHQLLPSDFASFYAAGRLALAGEPQRAYDPAAHDEAEQHIGAGAMTYTFFFYPPTFLVFCAVLAMLPFWPAFALFQASTLAFYLWVLRRIQHQSGWSWCIPVLAFPSVLWVIGLGQNAFLTAALFGLGTLLIDERPALAGAAFGLLCYKPHFGLLVPLALAAGRRWAAFAAAAATLAGAVTVSVCLFGWATWHDYVAASLASRTVYESGRIVVGGFVTPFGAARVIGLPPADAYAVQAAATLAAAACVIRVWRGGARLPARAGVLAAATLLAVPLALVYDLLLLTVSIFWLVREGTERGFLPWEIPTLVGVYAAALISLPVATELSMPIAPFASAAVLLLWLVRLRHEPAAHGLSAGLA